MAVLAGLDVTTASTGLAAVATGGAINEDVMQKIWDISKIPLPFLDRVGRGRVTAHKFDWVRDRLADAADNAYVERATYAASVSAPTDFTSTATSPLNRFQNHVQISVKAVAGSEMSDQVSSIGGAGGLGYNLMVAQQELMRDIEFSIVNRLGASVAGTASTAPRAASYISILDVTASGVVANDTFSQAGSGLTQGGWETSGNTWAIPTGTCTRGGITEALIRTTVKNLHKNGACDHDKGLVAMCSPDLKETISQYMFTSSARIGSLVKETGDSNGRAVGSIEYFQTDFGLLQLVPNRFMSTLTLTNAFSSLWIFDPAQFELVYLRGPTTTALAKQGLVDVRMVNAYWSTRFHPEACGGIVGILASTAMTA